MLVILMLWSIRNVNIAGFMQDNAYVIWLVELTHQLILSRVVPGLASIV